MRVDQLKTAIDLTLAAFGRQMLPLLRSGYSPDDPRASAKALAPSVARLVRETREQIYKDTVLFLRDQAELAGIEDAYIPTMSGYSDTSAETVLRRAFRKNSSVALKDAMSGLSQHVVSAQRQTIIRSVEDGLEDPVDAEDRKHLEHTRVRVEDIPNDDDDEGVGLFFDDSDDGAEKKKLEEKRKKKRRRRRKGRVVLGKDGRPISWARILTGSESCAFCVMLASRGPVYSTAEEAGRAKASDAFRESGAVGWVNVFHPGCDCMVVPVYDQNNWPGRKEWKDLEKFYDKVVEQEWVDKDGNAHKGITSYDGPSNGSTNQVLLSLAREITRLNKEGESLPVPVLSPETHQVLAQA